MKAKHYRLIKKQDAPKQSSVYAVKNIYIYVYQEIREKYGEVDDKTSQIKNL